MREIKFRAWNKANKRMTEYFYTKPLGSINEVFADDGKYEFMQYTGLKDKNGGRIFKGDIVKAWVDFGPAGEEQRVFEVKISSFGVNIQEFNFKEAGYLPEIIGNIYENADLLEEK